MTGTELWLAQAERELADYHRRKARAGFLPKGMYEEIGLERMVASAKEAVEQERAKQRLRQKAG